MAKNEAVSLRILEKICRERDCDFGDIVHYVKDEKDDYERLAGQHE